VRRDVPAPDSAAEGRTPYYFVPGEALVAIVAPEAVTDEAFLSQVAGYFEALYAPTGEEGVSSYRAPKEMGWITVLRLRWAGEVGYGETLKRFAKLEAQINAGVILDGKRVSIWMPNWLGTIAGSQKMYTPGGPAAYPHPVPAPEEGLPLVEREFLHNWRSQMQSPVTLALLDTFPKREMLSDDALQQVPNSIIPLIEQLQNKPDTLSLDASQHYAAFYNSEPFDMSDHGLMTTWLAAEVIGEVGMGHVSVEAVPIATTEGICSAADVIAGLAPLARRASEGEKIVALLGFVLGMGHIIPPRLRPYEEHYELLRLLCLSLNEAGAVQIGAAGNDASGLQHPPRTHRPASFRSVIDVTAGQLEQSDLALYANQAKALCLFGGEANLQYKITEQMPSLIGPSLKHAWVAWAGTSFAAALAAGLAVLRCSQNSEFNMWDIRTQLRNVATETRHPGNVPFVTLIGSS
jgi:hypothetical protein